MLVFPVIKSKKSNGESGSESLGGASFGLCGFFFPILRGSVGLHRPQKAG